MEDSSLNQVKDYLEKKHANKCIEVKLVFLLFQAHFETRKAERLTRQGKKKVLKTCLITYLLIWWGSFEQATWTWQLNATRKLLHWFHNQWN